MIWKILVWLFYRSMELWQWTGLIEITYNGDKKWVINN